MIPGACLSHQLAFAQNAEGFGLTLTYITASASWGLDPRYRADVLHNGQQSIPPHDATVHVTVTYKGCVTPMITAENTIDNNIGARLDHCVCLSQQEATCTT